MEEEAVCTIESVLKIRPTREQIRLYGGLLQAQLALAAQKRASEEREARPQ